MWLFVWWRFLLNYSPDYNFSKLSCIYCIVHSYLPFLYFVDTKIWIYHLSSISENLWLWKRMFKLSAPPFCPLQPCSFFSLSTVNVKYYRVPPWLPGLPHCGVYGIVYFCTSVFFFSVYTGTSVNTDSKSDRSEFKSWSYASHVVFGIFLKFPNNSSLHIQTEDTASAT